MLVFVFVALLLLSFTTASLMLRPKAVEKVVERRMQFISTAQRNESREEASELPVRQEGGLSYRLGEYVKRFHFSEDIAQLILYAGSKASVGSVVSASLLLAVAGGIAAQVFLGAWPLDAAAFVAGGMSRWGLLKLQGSRRLKKFTEALPDAIELVARALRAGHSMSSAIEIVAEQSAEPLASEFALVFQQQKFGIPFRTAILEFGTRVPSKDLHFLITAILVQKETGGDLTEILDRTTHVIRERVRIEGEIKTRTAQGRLTGWILSALPVIMLGLINIATPGYTHVLFTDPLGQKLLYGGGIMIVIGGLIIRKIVDIQV